MPSHLRTATTTPLSEDESSASLEAARPQQLSLFKSTVITSEPFERVQVTGPSKSGKSTDNHLQGR